MNGAFSGVIGISEHFLRITTEADKKKPLREGSLSGFDVMYQNLFLQAETASFRQILCLRSANDDRFLLFSLKLCEIIIALYAAVCG